MTLVLPAVPRKQTAAQKLSLGLGRGLEQGKMLFDDYQQKQQLQAGKQQMNQFGQQYGIPNLGELPPEIQKEIVSKTLASGFKQETPLQKEQRLLAEQRRIGLENQQKRFSNLFPNEESQNEPMKGGLQNYSDEKLREIASYKGQPGEMGIYGNEAERILSEKKEKFKTDLQEKQFFHNESKKYDETLTDQSIAAEKKNRALESQLSIAHKLGKWDRVVSALAGQSKWGNLLKSKNAQEFDSYALPQMEGLRQVLGGVLSDSDIRLIMQKVVTSDKTPEANKAIAKYLMSENNLLIAKKQIGDELKRNNGGYRPSNYDSEIEKIFNERYEKQIKSDFNDLMSLPDDPKKLNQVGRRTVPPGTPLGENAIKMYFELANGDPMKATELAEEDGYHVPK